MLAILIPLRFPAIALSFTPFLFPGAVIERYRDVWSGPFYPGEYI